MSSSSSVSSYHSHPSFPPSKIRVAELTRTIVRLTEDHYKKEEEWKAEVQQYKDTLKTHGDGIQSLRKQIYDMNFEMKKLIALADSFHSS
jgi:hemerythrin